MSERNLRPHERLEVDFAKFLALPSSHMVVCSSGTAALHLALECLSLPHGSAVIVPDYTMVACARACSLANLVPVFADCDDDLNVNPLSVAKVAHRERHRVKALMAVHIYGRWCDMTQLVEIADQYNLAIIEDMAELHGFPPHERTAAACWSFYSNKVIGGEEGGAVYFSQGRLAGMARCLRSLGFNEDHNYYHLPRGHNYRLADSLALEVLDSLRWYEAHLARRRTQEEWYEAACPREWRQGFRASPWVYDIRVPSMSEAQQTKVVSALQSIGVQARHGFKPMTWQPEYAHQEPMVPLSTLNWRAAKAAHEVLYLPLRPDSSMSRERALEHMALIRDVLQAPLN